MFSREVILVTSEPDEFEAWCTKKRLPLEYDTIDLSEMEGVCCSFRFPKREVIWLNQPYQSIKSVTALAHETLHAAENVLSQVGIPPEDEQLAYLQGFYFSELLKRSYKHWEVE
jgi:hypothetical protein